MLDNPDLALHVAIYMGQALVDAESYPDAYTRLGVEDRLDQGATLILRGLQRRPGAVRDMCLALAEEGWPTVHAYCTQTPAGVQGLPVRWHMCPTIVVQLRGQTTYRVFRPVVKDEESVLAQWTGGIITGAELNRLAQGDTEVADLSPGGGLFIPAAWPYYGVSATASRSVSVCPLSQRVAVQYRSDDHSLQLVGW
jgi:hypothetical protein